MRLSVSGVGDGIRRINLPEIDYLKDYLCELFTIIHNKLT